MAANTNAYLSEHDSQLRQKLIEKKSELPRFCASFFSSLDNTSKLDSTQLGYASDLDIFFDFIIDTFPEYADTPKKSLPIDCLTQLTKEDIEYYIGTYLKDMRDNNDKARARKLASLRRLYKHFYANKKIEYNPADFLEITFNTAKKDEDINYLRPNEVAILLDAIDKGEGLPEKYVRSKWYQRNRLRDLAIVTLLLGTGMRISECVGLDLDAIDFENGSIYIIRKGHKGANIPMGDEVEQALRTYIKGDPERPESMSRAGYEPDEKDKNALFLSPSHKRLTVRAIENLIPKYVQYALPQLASRASFSPHKMRASFGTNLYAEIGDVKAVADLLGHKSTQTTETFYISRSRDERRRAAIAGYRMRED